MRLGFVYESGLIDVGFTRNMDIDSTFGEEIDVVCEVLGWQEDEWIFMFNSKIIVTREWTPREMGFRVDDSVKIYCVNCNG